MRVPPPWEARARASPTPGSPPPSASANRLSDPSAKTVDGQQSTKVVRRPPTRGLYARESTECEQLEENTPRPGWCGVRRLRVARMLLTSELSDARNCVKTVALGGGSSRPACSREPAFVCRRSAADQPPISRRLRRGRSRGRAGRAENRRRAAAVGSACSVPPRGPRRARATTGARSS